MNGAVPPLVPPGDDDPRLEALAGLYLQQLRSGEEPEIAEIAAAHADIAEALSRRLHLVERLFKAVATPPPRDRRWICPHCGECVERGELQTAEVTCKNCGSSFRVDLVSTASYHGSGLPAAIGRFQILKLLGRGTFGQVYQARDHQLDRTVAVKIPRAESFANREDEQRFLREARSAAGLRHSGIVQVHEVAREGDLPYIVSDYINGMTLADLLSGGRIGVREAASLVAELADALGYAHRHGVVHRDIKPSNILLSTECGDAHEPNGSRFNPMISDFGLARRDEGEITVTCDGQVLGTPAYMSPEQAAGNHQLVDGRSDVYSLGVVLYELLTGELPFRGNQRMLLHQVLHDDPRPPRSLNDRLPRDLETICLKAMAKEPARRYRSAADLASDLRRYLRGDPIHARPVGYLERTWRWCRRKPAAAGLIASATALLVVLAVGGAWMAIREKAVADEQRQSAMNESNLRGDVEEALSQSNARLVQNYVANGARWMDNEDISASLVWNVEALKAVQGDAEREFPHRLRLQSALRACPRPVQIWAHDTGVTSADFVPDSRLVMTAAGSELFLWDIDTGLLARPPMKHPAAITHAACSADGRYLLSLCDDHAARLWSTATGKQEGLDLVIEGGALSAAISPDGKLVAAGGKGAIQIWHVEDGSALGPPFVHEEPRVLVTEMLFNPTSDRLLTSASMMLIREDRILEVRAEFDIWDVATGQFLARSPLETPFPGYPKGAIWNHAGDRIASFFNMAADKDGAWIWDSATGRELAQVAPGDEVSAVQFSPDDRLVATAVASVFHASSINDGYVWNSKDGSKKAGPLRHYGRINSIEFSPDSGHIATASDDRTARVWEATTGKPATPPLHHGLAVEGAKFGQEGRLLLTFSRDKTARLWDLSGCHTSAPPLIMADWNDDIARSDDGQLLALETPQHDVAIFDLATEEQISHLQTAREGGVKKIQFSPDRRRLVTTSHDETAKLWDVQTGKLAVPPLRHGLPVRDLRFSHTGRYVGTRAATHEAEEVQLWDAETGKEKLAAFTSPHQVYDLEFSRDDRLFAVVSCERVQNRCEIVVWEIGSGKLVHRLRPEATLIKIEFSPDNRLLAAASGWDFSGINDDALIFDLASGQIVASLPHTGGVRSARFSPDGRRLATASADGNVTVWDTESWQRSAPVIPLPGVREVWAEFSDDGRSIITSDLRQWDTAMATPVTLPAPAAQQILVLAPGGSTLAREASFKPQMICDESAEPRSVEEWEHLAAMVSGRRMDITGSLVPLDSAALVNQWKSLNRAEPYLVPLSESATRDWHERAAIRLFAQGNWWGARWHLRQITDGSLKRRPALALALATTQIHLGNPDAIVEILSQLLESRPNERPLLLQRALALVAKQKWTEAVADFSSLARTSDHAPQEQAQLYYQAALCCLAANDQAGYRKQCQELLERLGGTEDLAVAARIAYTLTPGQQAVDDYGEVLRLSRFIATNFAYGARLVGASLYRAGQVDEVETQFDIAGKQNPPRAWDCYFLAMACQRLGKQEQARNHLNMAQQWWDSQYDKVAWTEQIEMRHLRQEAEELIGNPPH